MRRHTHQVPFLVNMAAVEVKFRLVRSKSFDASLSRLPSIHSAGAVARHQSRKSSRVSPRNTNNSVSHQPVIIISQTALANASAARGRRTSLKDHDLLKSMLEQFSKIPKPPASQRQHNDIQETNRETHRQRHTSDGPLHQRFTKSANGRLLERRRSDSAICLSRTRLPRHSTEAAMESSHSDKSMRDKHLIRQDLMRDPVVRESMDKCRRWVDGLPEKFSGMHNAGSLPIICTDPD